MLVNGQTIEYRRRNFVVIPFSHRIDGVWRRVVNLDTGEESQACTLTVAKEICDAAVKGELLGTFGLKKEGKPLKVVFRKYPEGDVIALFCHSAGDCNPGNVMCYQHVGQHGEASRGIGRDLALATPAEFNDLMNELRGIYDCAVISVNRLIAN